MGWDMILVDGTSPGGSKPCRLIEIFDADWQAMQQREIVSAHDDIFSLFGSGSAPWFIHRDKGVDGGVHLPDARKTALKQLDG
jgi:hypothetical protein